MPTRYRILEGATRQFIRERTRDLEPGLKGDGLAKFANLIGISVGQLSRVLNGRVALSFEMGARIANGLGVPIDAVMEPVRDNDDDTAEVHS
jgi:transcriptional regulator with XRE-family HTH domain